MILAFSRDTKESADTEAIMDEEVLIKEVRITYYYV